ncbi:MAG: heparinase II/III family protein [Armatimonadetes bacterium]|nr:heparinase II/III family protein [Armatimonadota bacterium]
MGGLCSLIGGCLAVLGMTCLSVAARAAEKPAGSWDRESILEGLRRERPRIMLTGERLKRLKTRHRRDSLLQRYVKDVLEEADRMLDIPALRHEIPDGLRLLAVSRACLHRVSTLAFAYRWTEDARYAEAALRELRAVCAFPDWNPSHFLDTAEMTAAVAIGYDWLFGVLDDATRAFIHEALIRLGLEPGLMGYRGERYGFPRMENNWNQVCNFGMSVGALAVADTDPEIAREILAGAVASLPIAMKHYAPDGAWMEGPGYWNYATSYVSYGIAALDSALGRDLETSRYPGLAKSGYFPIYGAGPTGSYLSYADAGMMSQVGPQACLFFLAGKFRRPEFADAEHDVLQNRKASAFHVVWYQPPSGRAWKRDRDRAFGGPVPVAMFRSAWNDPDALWVGVKAGFNQVPHGHLDLGNFEMDALGVRWAVDLGADNYNLPGYWDSGEGGQRWKYYRLNSRSHNVCLIDGQDQRVTGKSHMARWDTLPGSGAAVIDLTEGYANVKQAARGVKLFRDVRAVLVQDEFDLASPCDLTWGMTTRANIRIESNGSVLLAQDGKRLRAKILEPSGARFEAASAERSKPEAENAGFRRLLINLKGATGERRIAVLFTPEGGDAPEAAVKPLADWPGKPVR